MTKPSDARTAAELSAQWEGRGAAEIVAAAAALFPGRLAVVSSFGAESAVLLKAIAEVDPALPVIFLDTHLHFAQTLQYRDRLARHFALRDVRTVVADARERAVLDPQDVLWKTDIDGCCALRKVRPLAQALAPFEAWISGRKRFQADTRAALPLVEWDGAHIKFNPLATLSPEDLAAAIDGAGLPAHPLRAQGYASIGCWPCTQPVAEGESARAGRWRGAAKTECGIHRPVREIAS